MKRIKNSLIITALLSVAAIGTSVEIIENTNNIEHTFNVYNSKNKQTKTINTTNPTPKTDQEDSLKSNIWLARSGHDSSGNFDPSKIPAIQVPEGQGNTFGFRLIIDGASSMGINSEADLSKIDMNSLALYINDKNYDILYTDELISSLGWGGSYGGRIGFTLPIYLSQEVSDDLGIKPNTTEYLTKIFGADTSAKVNFSFKVKQSDGTYKAYGIENGNTGSSGSENYNKKDVTLNDFGFKDQKPGSYSTYKTTFSPLPSKFKSVEFNSFNPGLADGSDKPSFDLDILYEEGGDPDSGKAYVTATNELTNNLIDSEQIRIKANESFNGTLVQEKVWKGKDEITAQGDVVDNKQTISIQNGILNGRTYDNFEFSSDSGLTWTPLTTDPKETTALSLENITSEDFNSIIFDSNNNKIDFKINVKSSGQHEDFDPTKLDIKLYNGLDLIDSSTSTLDKTESTLDTDGTGYGVDKEYSFTVTPTSQLSEITMDSIEVDYDSQVAISKDEDILGEINTNNPDVIVDQDGESVIGPGGVIENPLKSPKNISNIDFVNETINDTSNTVNISFDVPETETGYKSSDINHISFIDTTDETVVYEEDITTNPGERFEKSFDIPLTEASQKQIRVDVNYANKNVTETIVGSTSISTTSIFNSIVKESISIEGDSIKFTADVSGDVNNIQMAYGDDWESAIKLTSNHSAAKTGTTYNLEFSGLESQEYDLSKLLLTRNKGTTVTSIGSIDKNDPVFDGSDNPAFDNAIDTGTIDVQAPAGKEWWAWLSIAFAMFTVIASFFIVVASLFKKKK